MSVDQLKFRCGVELRGAMLRPKHTSGRGTSPIWTCLIQLTPNRGGAEDECEPNFPYHETPVLEEYGPHPCRSRLGTGALCAIRVASYGRHQDAVDCAMESLRPGIRQMV